MPSAFYDENNSQAVGLVATRCNRLLTSSDFGNTPLKRLSITCWCHQGGEHLWPPALEELELRFITGQSADWLADWTPQPLPASLVSLGLLYDSITQPWDLRDLKLPTECHAAGFKAELDQSQ